MSHVLTIDRQVRQPRAPKEPDELARLFSKLRVLYALRPYWIGTLHEYVDLAFPDDFVEKGGA